MLSLKVFVIILTLNLIIYVEFTKAQQEQGDQNDDPPASKKDDEAIKPVDEKDPPKTTGTEKKKSSKPKSKESDDNEPVDLVKATVKSDVVDKKTNSSQDADKAEDNAKSLSDSLKELKLGKVNNGEEGETKGGQLPPFSVDEPSSGNFIVYFMIGCVFVIGGYLLYNRRKKVMGVIVEGWNKSDQRSGRRRGGGGEQSYSRLANDAEDQA